MVTNEQLEILHKIHEAGGLTAFWRYHVPTWRWGFFEGRTVDEWEIFEKSYTLVSDEDARVISGLEVMRDEQETVYANHAFIDRVIRYPFDADIANALLASRVAFSVDYTNQIELTVRWRVDENGETLVGMDALPDGYTVVSETVTRPYETIRLRVRHSDYLATEGVTLDDGEFFHEEGIIQRYWLTEAALTVLWG